MACAYKTSDAVAIALHAAAYLAANGGRLASAKEIARAISASEAHLAKVLQRLAKAGVVASVRGPRGGFTLSRAPEKTPLLAVYEAIEGPLEVCSCLFSTPICGGKRCIFRGLVRSLNEQVHEYLNRTTLAEAAAVYRRENNASAQGREN